MENITETIQLATDILREKPLLRRVSGNAIVSGDLHGDIDALNRVLRVREEKKATNTIFLGDYVDRGEYQIEVITKLAELIIEDPSVTVLRGNHEDVRVCSRYGFANEIEKKGLDLEIFGEFFSQLPYGAYSKNSFFSHGGIPVDPEFDIKQINEFPRESVIKSSEFAKQILWNDPIFDNPVMDEVKDLPSPRGIGIKQFGTKVTDNFLQKHEMSMLIRAHIAFVEGYRWMQNDRILSLFTSSSGSYKNNYQRKVAYLDLQDKNLTRETIEVIDISER